MSDFSDCTVEEFTRRIIEECKRIVYNDECSSEYVKKAAKTTISAIENAIEVIENEKYDYNSQIVAINQLRRVVRIWSGEE